MRCAGRLHRGWVAQVLAVGLLAAGLAAADGAPVAGPVAPPANQIQLAFVKVVAFKDGNCLIIKHGVGTTDANGEMFTEEVPDTAILGSFWAVPADGRMLSMTAGLETVVDKATVAAVCTSHLEILRANKGKECTVVLGDKTSYSGVIREVLLTESEVAAPVLAGAGVEQPVYNRFAAYPGYGYGHVANAATSSWAPTAESEGVASTVTAATGHLFVLKTAAGDVLLPVAEIRSLQVADLTLTADRVTTTTRKTKRLRFKFDQAGKRQELELMYFTPGFRWVPTYRLAIAAENDLKKEGTLSLQAELLNEIEDLTDVPIDLVVGVPNFRFKDTVSPLSLETVLRSVLAHTMDNNVNLGQQLSNSYFDNRADVRHGGGAGLGNGGAMAELPAELTAVGSQDLFVYSLRKMTIKKGQRAAVPIFEVMAPYRDVYTWSLEPDLSAQPVAADSSPIVLRRNPIWHQLELSNGSQVPWTTGPVMIMQGDQPIAQDLLTYTPVKGSVQVPLTVAVDVVGGYAEKETERKFDALIWQGYHYHRVAQQGSLSLVNRKALPIQVKISLVLPGKALKAGADGRITLLGALGVRTGNDPRNNGVNTPSRVDWTVELDPGEALETTVDYEYYFPR